MMIGVRGVWLIGVRGIHFPPLCFTNSWACFESCLYSLKSLLSCTQLRGLLNTADGLVEEDEASRAGRLVATVHTRSIRRP